MVNFVKYLSWRSWTPRGKKRGLGQDEQTQMSVACSGPVEKRLDAVKAQVEVEWLILNLEKGLGRANQ